MNHVNLPGCMSHFLNQKAASFNEQLPSFRPGGSFSSVGQVPVGRHQLLVPPETRREAYTHFATWKHRFPKKRRVTLTIWVFPTNKLRGKTPEMDGLYMFIYNGKAYFLMDDLGIPFFF